MDYAKLKRFYSAYLLSGGCFVLMITLTVVGAYFKPNDGALLALSELFPALGTAYGIAFWTPLLAWLYSKV